MTIKEIKEKVKDIERISNDNEDAHVAEDNLYIEFVEYIEKTGSKEQQKMAKEILKTNKISYDRWYA